MRKLTIVAVVLVAAVVGQCGVACAATQGGVIDIGQAFSDAVAPYINALVNGLLATGISWVVWKINQKTGVQIDQGHSDALTHALQSEASSLIADGAVTMNGLKVDVGNAALADAVNGVIKRAPAALDHFGLTPDVVAERIIDAIPQTAAGSQIVAAAHAAAAVDPAKPAGV